MQAYRQKKLRREKEKENKTIKTVLHKEQESNYSSNEADGIAVTYYTDPLCCWSWAMEPHLRRLQYEFGANITWRYCMGGLLPSWKNFNDPVNAVSRPLQMGPVWMHAARLSGMSIDHNLWMRDPPTSSYPACIAFKSVQIQSTQYAELYLRLLREACMLHGKNISRQEELVTLAKRLNQYYPDFNLSVFKEDLLNGKGREAFRVDLNEVNCSNIVRFPSMIFRKRDQPSILFTGYRSYKALLEIIERMAPDLRKQREVNDPETYRSHWVTITDKEVDEALINY
jgi:predicted DsbA family dithiol-disulfide isomerase